MERLLYMVYMGMLLYTVYFNNRFSAKPRCHHYHYPNYYYICITDNNESNLDNKLG